MTLADLRRFAPDDPRAWEARLDDVVSAAMHLAFAARLPNAPADVKGHWDSLPSLDRSRWFAFAWKTVTERADA